MKGTVARTSDGEATPPFSEIDDLGPFGAMALLAMIQCGAEPGYRHIRRLPARAERLAPHRGLRHRVLVALLECGVLVPAAERRLRLDSTLSESGWESAGIEDADWAIHWHEATRGSLPNRLRDYLDALAPTDRNREILMETWAALATAECLAFGEHALSSHRMDPSIVMAVEPVLGPILAQRSIGQGCALMWWGAKNVAAPFLRRGGQPGLAERELERTIVAALDRDVRSGLAIPLFQRHHTQRVSTMTRAFLTASRLGDAYWDSPVCVDALMHARPAEEAMH